MKIKFQDLPGSSPTAKKPENGPKTWKNQKVRKIEVGGISRKALAIRILGHGFPNTVSRNNGFQKTDSGARISERGLQYTRLRSETFFFCNLKRNNVTKQHLVQRKILKIRQWKALTLGRILVYSKR